MTEKTDVIKWAGDLLRESFVVFDTETTGLEGNARIVSIGIVDQDGTVLLDTLINPETPIPPDATRVHGVTDAMVANAPTFAKLYPEICAELEDRVWVIYNAAYDMARLRAECARIKQPCPNPKSVHCAMEQYAIFHGDYNDWHGSYTWQSLVKARKQMQLPATDAHNALGDALSTLHLIYALAEDD